MDVPRKRETRVVTFWVVISGRVPASALLENPSNLMSSELPCEMKVTPDLQYIYIITQLLRRSFIQINCFNLQLTTHIRSRGTMDPDW